MCNHRGAKERTENFMKEQGTEKQQAEMKKLNRII